MSYRKQCSNEQPECEWWKAQIFGEHGKQNQYFCTLPRERYYDECPLVNKNTVEKKREGDEISQKDSTTHLLNCGTCQRRIGLGGGTEDCPASIPAHCDHPRVWTMDIVGCASHSDAPVSCRYIYLLSIVNVDSCSHRYVCDTKKKAFELFDELRQGCINENLEGIEYSRQEGMEWNIPEIEKDNLFLITMKPGDIPPHCMDHPIIDEYPVITSGASEQSIRQDATEKVLDEINNARCKNCDIDWQECNCPLRWKKDLRKQEQ